MCSDFLNHIICFSVVWRKAIVLSHFARSQVELGTEMSWWLRWGRVMHFWNCRVGFKSPKVPQLWNFLCTLQWIRLSILGKKSTLKSHKLYYGYVVGWNLYHVHSVGTLEKHSAKSSHLIPLSKIDIVTVDFFPSFCHASKTSWRWWSHSFLFLVLFSKHFFCNFLGSA